MVELRVHRRLVQQGIGEAALRPVLEVTAAKIIPFQGHAIHTLVALVDWDHRLPSKQLTMRLHVLYDARARERFEQAFERREREIGARDVYPEFDVADYAGLPADESYEVDLDGDLGVDAIRLTSPWRREVGEEEAALAVAAVRDSTVFGELSRDAARPAALGDLEAVGWQPPCESGQVAWTLDVWWLTAFDGRVGRGWSFLVDPTRAAEERVLASREFTVRAS